MKQTVEFSKQVFLDVMKVFADHKLSAPEALGLTAYIQSYIEEHFKMSIETVHNIEETKVGENETKEA